ncbi:MAG TPA: hypothetical protein VFX25_39330 [Streptosporangiaceae bacterium]|nr:hypothetical protein [Streptosporangiaceae bacterium]
MTSGAMEARDLLVRRAQAVRGRAVFELACHPAADIVLEWRGEVRPLTPGETGELFTQTSGFWQAWVGQSRYRGRWRETVQRSALAPKLSGPAPSPCVKLGLPRPAPAW